MDNEFTRHADGDAHVKNDTPGPAAPAPLAGFRAVRPPPPVARFSVFGFGPMQEAQPSSSASRIAAAPQSLLTPPVAGPAVPSTVTDELAAESGLPRND